MNDIISKMRSELRMILKKSVEDYATKPRDQWQFDWPSQVILVVNQIYWCQEVEQVRERVQNGDGELCTTGAGCTHYQGCRVQCKASSCHKDAFMNSYADGPQKRTRQCQPCFAAACLCLLLECSVVDQIVALTGAGFQSRLSHWLRHLVYAAFRRSVLTAAGILEHGQRGSKGYV